MSEVSKLVLKPINDLLSERFFIPKYQRGYRWDQRQVKALLDDIWEFYKKSQDATKDTFYCLQPVVVSKKNDEWELIDGQQRLTTINILLEYLKEIALQLGKSKYSIRYETRQSSEDFLNNINLDQKNENVDYYHICTAFETIDEWFKGKDGTFKFLFLSTLLNNNEIGKNVKVIWYDVSDENKSEKYAIDIFTRINIGKIPLTNAELIKALFLQEKNFESSSFYLKQLKIATEWNDIENQLENDSFWYFIYNTSNPIKYDTRIEYLFDLMKGKSDKDEHFKTFNAFLEEFEAYGDALDIEGEWLEIKNYFQTLKEWYNNYNFYHLIGFLIEFGTSISDLKTRSERMDKDEFNQHLKGLVMSFVNCDIRELSYGDYKIKRVLLLFNLETLLQSKNHDSRFPFAKYKTGKWDIEHVRSQTDVLISKSNRRDWLMDVLEYFTGSSLIEHQSDVIMQRDIISSLGGVERKFADEILDLLTAKTIGENSFKILYDELTVKYFKEGEFPDKDGIGNLALLDAKTNRSYKNAMFPIKRRTIIANDMSGTFVPICTKNVFLKSYSQKMGEVMYWSPNDASDYTETIEKTLKEYIKINAGS